MRTPDGKHRECAFGGYGNGHDRCRKQARAGALMCHEHQAWSARMTLALWPRSPWAHDRVRPILGDEAVREAVSRAASEARSGATKVIQRRHDLAEDALTGA